MPGAGVRRRARRRRRCVGCRQGRRRRRVAGALGDARRHVDSGAGQPVLRVEEQGIHRRRPDQPFGAGWSVEALGEGLLLRPRDHEADIRADVGSSRRGVALLHCGRGRRADRRLREGCRPRKQSGAGGFPGRRGYRCHRRRRCCRPRGLRVLLRQPGRRVRAAHDAHVRDRPHPRVATPEQRGTLRLATGCARGDGEGVRAAVPPPPASACARVGESRASTS